MRKINRLHWLGVGLFLGTLLFPVLTIAQQPFPWESYFGKRPTSSGTKQQTCAYTFLGPLVRQMQKNGI